MEQYHDVHLDDNTSTATGARLKSDDRQVSFFVSLIRAYILR